MPYIVGSHKLNHIVLRDSGAQPSTPDKLGDERKYVYLLDPRCDDHKMWFVRPHRFATSGSPENVLRPIRNYQYKIDISRNFAFQTGTRMSASSIPAGLK
jgi:hypothetical protein